MGGMDPYGGMGGGDPYGGYGGDGPGEMGARLLESIESIEVFLIEDEFVPAVIGYFDEVTNTLDKEHFETTANSLGNLFRFGMITSKEVLDDKKYKGSVVYVHLGSKFYNEKYDKPKARYPGKSITSAEALETFIYSKALPLVGEINAQLAPAYLKRQLPIFTLFTKIDYDRNPKGFTYVINRARKVATEHKGKFLFAIGDSSNGMDKTYGYTEEEKARSVNVGILDGDMFYKMDTDFSLDTLKAFVAAFEAEALTGTVKKISSGGEDGDDDSEDFVVHLNAGNFQQEVVDSTADVLLEFYAPWCGHCKHLKPEFKVVAETFKDDAGITVAAFDATASDVPPGYDVQGYPTLFFLPADTKTPVSYEGGREAPDMIDFLKSSRTTTA